MAGEHRENGTCKCEDCYTPTTDLTSAEPEQRITTWKRPDGIVVTSYDVEVVKQWAQGVLEYMSLSNETLTDFDGFLSGFLGALVADSDPTTTRDTIAMGRSVFKARDGFAMQMTPGLESDNG